MILPVVTQHHDQNGGRKSTTLPGVLMVVFIVASDVMAGWEQDGTAEGL